VFDGRFRVHTGDRHFDGRFQMDSNMDSQLRYRPDIDGLRAVAVLSVVAFHAFPDYIAGGFVGVDVFFVISGYLITSILVKQHRAAKFSFGDFYSRRARRILPALCLVLLACLLFGYLALLPDEFANLGRHMAAAAAFAANLSFWQEAGYFAPASEFQPLLHLWSLGIEEQFYLVWPLVLAFAWRRKYNVLQGVLFLTAASFAANLVLTHIDSTAAFYFPLSRFWELGLGCALAVVASDPGSVHILPPRLARYSPIVGVGLIGLSLFIYDHKTPFPGIAAVVPTLGALAVLAGGEDSWFRRRVLASRFMVFIGLISYPLYLWHWPILSFEAILHSGTPQPIYRVAAILLSFLFAVLTYRLLELPIRQGRNPSTGLVLAGGAAAIGAVAITVVLHHGVPSRFPPTVSAMHQAPREDESCRESVTLSEEFNYCKRTSPQRPEIIFLGDSQAQGVYEGTVSTLGAKHSMMLLARGGCPPGLNVVSAPGVYESEDRREVCNHTWASFVDFVRKTRPALVVLVGDGSRFFMPLPDDDEDKDESPGVDSRPEAFRQGLGELVKKLEPFSQVAYVLEIPTFDTPPACFLRPVKLPGSQCSKSISRPRLVASRTAYEQSVGEIRSHSPNMLVVDPIPSLCGANSCSQTSHGGQVLYSDTMHLSPAGGRRFAQNSGLAALVDQAARSVER
jgi:peptidoglycan/LPS O-acetylase OafA/YrhL